MLLTPCFAVGPALAAGSNMPWEQPLNQILQSVEKPRSRLELRLAFKLAVRFTGLRPISISRARDTSPLAETESCQ